MDRFIDFLNSGLPDVPGDGILYDFKRKTLDDMSLRIAEVSSRGIENRAVLEDLVLSEHPDLKKEYGEYRKKTLKAQKSRKFLIRNIVGSVIWLLSVVVIYLLISFATHAWDMTWAVITSGVLFWVVYLLSVGVRYFTSLRMVFHVFARICLAGAVIVAMVAVYLIIVALTDLPRSWLIVIFGLIEMFACDGIFAVLAKHRLALINWLIYIPVIATFLFVILGALAVLPWGTAWMIIPLSLLVDIAVIVIAAGRRRHERTEVADAWNES